MFAALPAHAAIIGFDKSSSNPAESDGAVTVDLQASGNVNRDTLVTYTISGTSNNSDHDAVPGSVYILDGTSTASISFTLLDDTVYEDDETVIITITSVGTGSTIAAQNLHTMTIADNDAVPSLSLTPLDAAESSGSTQIQVVSDTVAAFDINFSYSTTDGTAVAGTNYTSTSGSGTITAGFLTTTISVPVTDDSDDNTSRTFTFNISSASLSNGTVATISESSDTATIIDDDLSISIDDVTVNENAGTATLTVTAANGPSLQSYVDIDYTTTNGTATSSGDFTTNSGTVRITSSDAGPIYFNSSETNTITVTITDDSVYESSEYLDVTLSNIQNATGSFSDSSGRITITDNDSVPVVDFNVTSSSGAESTTSAALQVDLSNASSSSVTVDYAVTGTASGSGADYTLADGTLTITAGDTDETITIASIVDDALAEGNETVIVTLSSPSGATLGTDTVHTYTITDNDSTIVDFNATSSSGAESTSSAALQVDLSSASVSNVTVDYAVTGTATGSGTDYTLADGTLTITAGDTDETITIASIVDDALAEGNETVIVTLSSPSGATLGADAVHTYTITDNDTPTVDFNATSSTGSESTASASVVLDLSPAAGSAVTVSYTATGGTASGSGTDYTLGSGTFTIPAGSTSETLSFATIVDDAIAEGDETIEITLSGPSGAALGADTVHTYTITDNDVAAVSAISDAELAEAADEVDALWRANDRLYNERVTDQSRQILQLSLNDTLNGDCGVTGHTLCGATIEVAKAARKSGKPDLLVQGGDDGVDASASFIDVQKLTGDGSKRIVSVATEYVDHKGKTSTHSVMASYAREYFDTDKNAAIGVMTHLYRAKTDVQGTYSGDAVTEGINIGAYTNYFGNMDYVMGLYGSIGFSETDYDLKSDTTDIRNVFDSWNVQIGANVMGKKQYNTVLFMPKFTLDTFVTKQKDSMPRVTIGSATRHGFIASRVLTEIQFGFRPHFKIANFHPTDREVTGADIARELDINPQIYCGYSANASDCGVGIGVTNKWKPTSGYTEYRVGGDFSEYRGDRKARVEFNMETEVFGNENMKSTTTVANDNIADGSEQAVNDASVNWRFDYNF